MDVKVCRKIILRTEEILILAAISGLKDYVGLCHKNLKRLTQEEIYYSLYTLNKNGWISWSSLPSNNVPNQKPLTEWKIIDDDIREIFQGILECNNILFIYQIHNAGPRFCCYVGEKVLLSEVSAADENAVKFCMYSKTDFFHELINEEIFPKQEFPLENKDVKEPYFDENIRKELNLSEEAEYYLNKDGFQTIIDTYDSFAVKKYQRIYLYQKGLKDYLVLQRQGVREKVYLYRKDMAEKILFREYKDNQTDLKINM